MTLWPILSMRVEPILDDDGKPLSLMIEINEEPVCVVCITDSEPESPA